MVLLKVPMGVCPHTIVSFFEVLKTYTYTVAGLIALPYTFIIFTVMAGWHQVLHEF